MQINSKKEKRYQKIKQALKNNLKKRKALQNKLKKSTRRVIKLKREISEECNNLKQKNGIYNPDQLALCDNLETMLFKKQTERKQIAREMKRIRKKLQESKENTKQIKFNILNILNEHETKTKDKERTHSNLTRK